MTLLRRNNGFYSAIPSLLEDYFADNWSEKQHENCYSGNCTKPAVNISEKDEAFVVELAAPGYKKEDFKVSIENNKLTISAVIEKESDSSKYSRREFAYGSFSRTFTVAENTIDNEKVEAKYNEGVLLLTLPKREEVKPKPAREIAIA